MSKKETASFNCIQHNVLTVGTAIVGNIQADEDFRIDGTVDGNVTCKGKIIIGPNGRIKGEVKCTVLDLSGTIEGIAKCSDTAIMRSTSLFIGELSMAILEVEPKARIQAAIETISGKSVVEESHLKIV